MKAYAGNDPTHPYHHDSFVGGLELPGAEWRNRQVSVNRFLETSWCPFLGHRNYSLFPEDWREFTTLVQMTIFKKILTLFGNYISIRINSSCLHAILLRISCRESFWQFKMKVSKKSLWETSETEGYVSALTLAELVYVMRKEQNQKGVHDILSFYDASDWISSCNDPFTQSFLFCYH